MMKKKCKMQIVKCKMQNANFKIQNAKIKNKSNDFSDRLLSFGGNVIRLDHLLGKTAVGRHIANQLLRSATSTGANYEEACAAESRADFVHKLHSYLKVCRESRNIKNIF